ncbi:hypothetical protein ACRWXB_25625, partial [Escherichia coli]
MKDNKTRPVDSYAHADFMESVFSNLRAFCDAECQRRQPFVLFKGLTFQKLCLPGAFRPGDHHNKMLRP